MVPISKRKLIKTVWADFDKTVILCLGALRRAPVFRARMLIFIGRDIEYSVFDASVPFLRKVWDVTTYKLYHYRFLSYHFEFIIQSHSTAQIQRR